MPDVVLRELRRSDLERINAWRNDPEVVAHLGAGFLFLAPEVDEAWYDRYLAERGRAVRLAILEPGTRRHIGNVQLTDIHPTHRSAEFSIFIGEKDCWSRGFGTAAAREMLRHGFDDLNLHRIHLTVLADNERAIRSYEKLGFVREGTLRSCVFKNGRFHDMHVLSVLHGEWDG